MAVIDGTSDPETLNGTPVADTITGLDGDDSLIGDDGNDSIDGGAGDDTLSGGLGDDTLKGGINDDSILGGTGNDSLLGDAGNDSLYGDVYDDTLDGGEGNDYLDGGLSMDVLLDSDSSADTLLGGAAADTVVASAVLGNQLSGGSWSDVLGRDGNRLSYEFASSGVLVNLPAQSVVYRNNLGGAADTVDGFNEVIGSAFDDSIVGGDPAIQDIGHGVFALTEYFAPGAGVDTIAGGDGRDILRYDIGAASQGIDVDLESGTAIDPSGAIDVFSGIEGVWGTALNDTLVGSNSNSIVEFFAGGNGTDSINGGGGEDWLDFRYAAGPVNVNLGDATISGVVNDDGFGNTEPVANIEGIFGSAYNDSLQGYGEFGSITFEGGAGQDTLVGMPASQDVASYEFGEAGGAYIDLVDGMAYNDGWGSFDELFSIEHAIGTRAFSDTFVGNVHDNRFDGLGGDDTASGDDGNDTLIGGYGWDSLNGGNHDDFLAGVDGDNYLLDDYGSDTLVGGDGADTLWGGSYDSFFPGPGNDSVKAVGESSLYYDDATGAVHISLPDVTTNDPGSADDGHGTTDTLYLFRPTFYLSLQDDTVLGADAPLFDYDAIYRAGETVYAGDGNDSIVTRGGNDYLDGSNGNDYLDGGNDDDYIDAGDGDDTLLGGDGWDYLHPGNGNGVVDGGDGFDYAVYSNIDTVDIDIANGVVHKPFAATDTIAAIEHYVGSIGNDSFRGGSGDDRYTGGSGNDTFYRSTIAGPDGTDLLDYTWWYTPNGIVITLPDTPGVFTAAQDGHGGTDSIELGAADILWGALGSDSITGGDNGVADSVWGYYGNDTIRGRSGNDTLDGSYNDDLVDGGAGNDSLVGSSGSDTLMPGEGNDQVDGGSEFDIVDYSNLSSFVSVHLPAGAASKASGEDTLFAIEGAVGSQHGDNFLGNDDDNTFKGLGGADTFLASAGIDTLFYDDSTLGEGVGVTVVLPSDGLSSGSASDGHGDTDVIHFGAAEKLYGSNGPDNLTGAGTSGGAGNDSIWGLNGDDTIDGLAGDDVLTGDGGEDQLDGGAGNDTLNGGDSNDTLVAGPGQDSLDGGNGTGDTAVMPFDFGQFVVLAEGPGLRLFSPPSGDSVLIVSIETVELASSETYATDTLEIGQYIEGSSDGATHVGSSGYDWIDAAGGNDLLLGGLGNDTLDGGAGNDSMAGGDDDDDFIPGGGADTVDGGDGEDVVRLPLADVNYSRARAGSDLLLTHGGDTILVLAGTEWVQFSDVTMSFASLLPNEVPPGELYTGDSGPNTHTSGGGPDTLLGLGGNDILDGGAYDDTVVGGDDNDSLIGQGGHDVLDGGNGQDTLVGGAGYDTLVGGDGHDWALYDGLSGPITVNLGEDNVDKPGGTYDHILEVEVVVGTSFDDDFTGDELGNWFVGLGGNDTFRGSDGIDFIGYSPSTLPIGVGVTVVLPASATVPGSASDGFGGTDVLQVGAAEQLGGSDGPDNLTGSPVFTVESVTYGHDSIYGYNGADTISGLGGNDLLDGMVGNDSLSGGDGNDSLVPGDGTDTVDGGAGTDTLVLPLPQSQYSSVASGSDVLISHSGGSVLLRANVEFVQFADVTRSFAQVLAPGQSLTGSEGADTLTGGAGPDTIRGRGGDDRIDGGAGDDQLNGDAGFDLLIPGAGNDTLNGGGSDDTVSYQTFGSPVVVNLTTLVVIKGSNTDTLSSIEAVIGSGFNDAITGNSRDNRFVGLGGNDTFHASSGIDLVDYNDPNIAPGQGVVVRLPTPTLAGTAQDGRGGTDTITWGGIWQVQGSAGPDSITGAPVSSDGTTTFGHDTLTGGDGNDTLRGLDGDDSLLGGLGNDRLAPGDGLDTAVGGDGSDTLELALARAAYRVFRVGTDVRIERDASNSVLLQQLEQVQFADALVPVSTLFSEANLVVTGGTGPDSLLGGPAADTLQGGAGNDTLKGQGGDDRLEPGDGQDSVDGGDGIDTAVIDGNRGVWDVDVDGSTLVLTRLSVALAGGVFTTEAAPTAAVGDRVRLVNVEFVQFGDQQFSATALQQSAFQTVTGTAGNDTLSGGTARDLLLGDVGNDVLIGGTGSDTLDGGSGIDIASWTGSSAVQASLISGTATQGLDTDTLLGIEAFFGGNGADIFRGADGLATRRGDTLRGGGGNDTLDGGTGIDTAEWLGVRSDYVVTQLNATTWTVQDVNPANGNEGTDTVSNIERFVFADQMLSFGTRAEELARVAMALWGPTIITSTTLFSRGFSFYDVGYSYTQMSQVALQFWVDLSDADLAARLIANSGSSKTVAQLLATMAANGGSTAGRAAAVREIADDASTQALLTTSGVKVTGVVSQHEVPDFGTLFGLLPG